MGYRIGNRNVFSGLAAVCTAFGLMAAPLCFAAEHGKNSEANSLAAKPEKTIRWLLAHEPVRVFERAAKNFKNEVERETAGKISVEILTTSDYRIKYGVEKRFEQGESFINDIELLRAGKVEMTQTYVSDLGAMNPRLWALELPFIFRDHGHAKKVLDGNIGQELLAGLVKNDIRGLAFTYSGGYRVISTRDKPLVSVKDFQNLLIRTSRSPVAKATFELLGSETAAMGHDAGIQQVKKGSLMAAETTFARFDEAQQKATPILNDTQHSLFLTSMIVNEKFFAALSPKFQEVVLAAAKNAAELERKDSLSDEADLRKQFKNSGMRIVKLPETEVAKMKMATRPVYKKFAPMFGAELIQAIEDVR